MNLDFTPKFVKKYSEMGAPSSRPLKDMWTRSDPAHFPDEAHSYHLKKEKLRSVGNDSR